MEKRVVIAVILSIAVLYGYSMLFPPPQKTEPPKPKPVAELQTTPAQAVSTASAPKVAVQQENVAARDVVVDTDLYTAVFPPGGRG